jgi:hypothetical protein
MLTLFSTPKPFHGHINIIQRNALQSWKLLHPHAEIILFGDDDGTAAVCQDLGLRQIPDVLRSPLGTKRLDSIFGQAQEVARHPLLSYVNCDIILTQDFLSALQRVSTWRNPFLMVGRRWDTDITTPIDFSRSDWQEHVVALAKSEGCQRFFHNVDYFAFSKGLYPRIPPLVIGRIWWDHWLVGKAHDSGATVVDVSPVVCAVHQNHDYGYHPKGMTGVWNDEDAQRNYRLARQEVRLRTIEDAPFRLTAAGFQRNRFYFLAPLKRSYRKVSRRVRGFLRTYFWHPMLSLTRPIRHALGLKKDALAPAVRSGERRHWMDQ